MYSTRCTWTNSTENRKTRIALQSPEIFFYTQDNSYVEQVKLLLYHQLLYTTTIRQILENQDMLHNNSVNLRLPCLHFAKLTFMLLTTAIPHFPELHSCTV